MAFKIDSKNHNSENHQRLKESQQSDTRFGKKSRSMFFIRHTAHPKNLRFITGVGGIQVCAMKEDSYNLPDNVLDQIRLNTLAATSVNPSLLSSQRSIENYISDPKYALKFDYSSTFNQDLLMKYEKKIIAKQRKERVLPPIKHWTSTYMIADDTKRWRHELNNLAKKVGIMTNEEVETNEAPLSQNTLQLSKSSKADNFEVRNVKSIEFQRSLTNVPSTSNNNITNTNATNQPVSKHIATTSRKKYTQEDSNGQYDRIKTGRFNEPKSRALGTRQLATSRMRTSINFSVNTNKTGTSNPNKVILCNEESEREMWLLQILCQILNTESMQDIQSWLVSSGAQEKEAMKELIQKALEGLNQSGRIDLDRLSLNPNDKTTQVDFEQIKSSITSMVENTKNVQFANNNNINNSINNLIINENKTDESTQTNVNTSFNNSNTDNIIGKLNLKLQAIESLSNKKEELKQTEVEIKHVVKKESTVKEEDEENQFTSGSELKSVSLINMDPYKFERTRTISTFEDYLSKSTYFRSKIRQMNQSCIPNKLEFSTSTDRPYTCKDAKQDTKPTFDLLNNRLSKKLINKFSRVELVDLKPINNTTTTNTNISTTTTNNNNVAASDSTAYAVSESAVDSSANAKSQTIKKTASFFKPDESVVLNSTNVKLKLDTSKDMQVLTIEDN